MSTSPVARNLNKEFNTPTSEELLSQNQTPNSIASLSNDFVKRILDGNDSKTPLTLAAGNSLNLDDSFDTEEKAFGRKNDSSQSPDPYFSCTSSYVNSPPDDSEKRFGEMVAREVVSEPSKTRKIFKNCIIS